MDAALIKDLGWKITEAANELGLIDHLLDATAKCLNRHRVRKLEEKLTELETRVNSVARLRKAILDRTRQIDDAINRIEDERNEFHLTDVLTLGIGWIVRQVIGAHEQRCLERALDRCDKKIKRLEENASRARHKIADLERAVKELPNLANPSLVARMIRFLQLAKHVVDALVAVIAGELARAFCSLWRAGESVATLVTRDSSIVIQHRVDAFPDSPSRPLDVPRCETCGRPSRLRGYRSCRACIHAAQSEAMRILSGGRRPEKVSPALQEVARDVVEHLPDSDRE